MLPCRKFTFMRFPNTILLFCMCVCIHSLFYLLLFSHLIMFTISVSFTAHIWAATPSSDVVWERVRVRLSSACRCFTFFFFFLMYRIGIGIHVRWFGEERSRRITRLSHTRSRTFYPRSDECARRSRLQWVNSRNNGREALLFFFFFFCNSATTKIWPTQREKYE